MGLLNDAQIGGPPGLTDAFAALGSSGGLDLDPRSMVGLAVYGPKNAVDKILKGARMHP